MDAFVVVASLLAFGVLLATALGHALGKGQGVIATFIGLETGPSRPRGIQEDDAPPRWKLDDRRD